MGASDHLGTTCVVLPRTMAITLVALAWFLVGLWHLAVIFQVTASGFLVSADEWGMEKSCQGSECHNQWREQLVSCSGTQRTTFQIRFLTVGVLGICFGAVGLNGATSHNHVQVRAFSVFFAAMIALFFCTLVLDLSYVQACGRMPLNMAKDVMMVMPGEVKDTLAAQGYTRIEKLPVERLKLILKMDFVKIYVGVYLTALVTWAYLAFDSYKLGLVIEGGPLGLGPLYSISTDPNRDINQAVQRFDALMDQLSEGAPNYDSLSGLQDAQKFPYGTLSGQKVAVPYGAIGVNNDAVQAAKADPEQAKGGTPAWSTRGDVMEAGMDAERAALLAGQRGAAQLGRARKYFLE